MGFLIIDGNSILNRAFYGIRVLTNSRGVATNAVTGFMNTLLMLEKDVDPDMIAVAFDLKAPTFRHKMYDGYKANRKGMPEDLAQQLPYMKKIITAMGITIIEKEGFEVTLLDVHENGMVSAQQVADAIREDTCLVSVMYANNEIGSIQPIAEIGAVCKEKGVIFHTDAVQAVGHVHINVKEENIDMLSLSAHKFHGPKGVGLLYARKGVRLTNIIEGGAQERGKRAGTENIPGIVGMVAALKEANANIDANAEKVSALRDRLIEGLEKIPHSALNGDRTKRLPGNVSFCFEGIEGESLLLLLDAKGICASSGSACTSGSLDPSHVLLAIGRPHEVAHGSLRLTLSEENTQEEVDYIIEETTKVVKYLRDLSPVWKELLSGERKFTF